MRTQLHHLLEEGAVRFGDRPALSHQEVTLDYTSTWDLASRTGAVLSGLGVARGDRVAVYLDKRPETIGGIFGASVAGGVFVPVNPALKGSQVAYILGDCDVRVLITTHQRWECHDVCRKLWVPKLAEAGVKLVISGHTHDHRWMPAKEGQPIAQLIGGGPQPRSATFIQLTATREVLTAKMSGLDGGVVADVTMKAG